MCVCVCVCACAYVLVQHKIHFLKIALITRYKIQDFHGLKQILVFVFRSEVKICYIVIYKTLGHKKLSNKTFQHFEHLSVKCDIFF